MSKVAYIAQPIDQVYDITIYGQDIHKITQQLCASGYHSYLPARAWSTCAAAGPDGRLEEINRRALAVADLLVAYLPKGVPSIGVPLEIAASLERGTPVVVVTQAESQSLVRPGIIVIDRVHKLGDALKVMADRVMTEQIMRASASTKIAADPITAEAFMQAHQARRDGSAIKIVLAQGHTLPARAYPDDAGLDLTTAREYTIRPGEFVDIHTQVDGVQLPDGHWGLITGRSSTLRRLKLHVPVAVIDPGWRGPLYVGAWNLSRNDVTVRPGDRIGQLILVPNNPAAVEAVEKVDEAPRGVQGFGSSG